MLQIIFANVPNVLTFAAPLRENDCDKDKGKRSKKK